MTSLNQLLQIGRSGLLTHQASIATASQNTANATTPGYAKRDVTLRSVGPGMGVEVESVRRRADTWMHQRVLLERSRLGAHQAQSQGLQALELHFEESETGIGGAFDRFFSRMAALSTAPTDRQLREDVLAQARVLTDTMSTTARMIEHERQQSDALVPDVVDRINALTSEIADLNKTIAARESAGGEASEERDRREVLLDELAENIDYNLITNDRGETVVLVAGGLALIDGQHRSTLASSPDAAYGGMRRVDIVSSSGLASDITGRLRNGKLGGVLELRDDTLAQLADKLDTLAYDFATSINAVHAAGYGMDGATGRDFFTQPSTVDGAAMNLSLAAGIDGNPDAIAASTTAAGAVGDNDNLLAIGNLADQKLASAGERTFAEEVASLTSTVGQAVAVQRDGIARSETQVAQLEALHDASTRVSLDEELIDITRFERAYQASARIVQTVDQMYETILQL